MQLPSLNQIFHSGRKTFRRFPLILVSALIATVSAFILTDYDGPEGPTVLFKILFASILGIPFLLGISLTAERRSWGTLRSYGAQLAGIILLIGYGTTVPSFLSSAPAFYVQRLLLLAVGMHMFVSVVPYLGSGGQDIFWHFNKTLFFRILGAALYSHILYLGLSLALAALDQLFGIDIPGKRYGELWIVTVGLLNTWLFLAGIPKDLHKFDQDTEYPKTLRILVQYVLGPLALIYVLIIYAYIVKIALSWEWSDGWISKLILGFAVTGIFSLLLLYPLHDREEMGWLKHFPRWFPVAMIPLVIVFPLALWRRLADYGITEARYIAMVLAAWLMVMVLYFILGKARNIKFFPISLGLLSLVVSFGPWSMFRISEQSQVGRLERLLVHDSILVDGHLRKTPAPIPRETSKHISSILDYLHEIHGFDRIQPWFSENLRQDSTGASLASKDPDAVAKMMGIEYVRLRPAGGSNLVNLGIDQNASIDVQGYDRMVRLQYLGRGVMKKEIPGENILIELSPNSDTLTVINKNDGKSLPINLRPLASSLLAEYANESVGNVPPEKLTVSSNTNGFKAKIILRRLQVHRREASIEISNVSVDVVYSSDKK